MDNDCPLEGYAYTASGSAFVDHVGRLYTRRFVRSDGTVEAWCAVRVEPHHVNTWNFAHGGFMATLAEIGTAQASWDPAAQPCVAVALDIQFIGAPRLGDWVQICGTETHRTRSLVFVAARALVDEQPVLVATSVQKIIETANSLQLENPS